MTQKDQIVACFSVPGSAGGDVPTALSLTLGAGPASFGSFVPATARNYDTALAATVVSTAGADAVTLGFRQAIGATEVLRAGSYSKTLRFTSASIASW